MIPFKKATSLLFLILLFGFSLATAQTNVKLPDILPPSPSSFALTRYGGINLGLQTGTAQYSVPIYNIKSRKLSLPISLSYSSNGIKVDELASRVGMSWALDAGGAITRTVYDDPDETSTTILPPASFDYSMEYYNYLETVGGDAGGSYDSAPDFFSFNFAGHSGQFIIQGNRAVQLTKSNLRIEIQTSGQSNFSGKFKITTPDGIIFYFGGVQNSVESSYNSNLGAENCGKSYRTSIDNAWYLSSIVHPDGDVINFTYGALDPYSYPAGISQSKTRSLAPFLDCGNTTVRVEDTNCLNQITTNTVYLKKISFAKESYVEFIYAPRQDLTKDLLLDQVKIFESGPNSPFSKLFKLAYQYATAGDSPFQSTVSDPSLIFRPFLTSLSESSSSLTEKHTFSFQYNNKSLLPPRLSFAQDHFGYFNGGNNSGLIPKPERNYESAFSDANADRSSSFSGSLTGMLNKVIYPTGGYDSIAYTVPIYTVNERPDPVSHSANVSTVGYGFSGPITVRSPEIILSDNQKTKFAASWQYRGDPGTEDFHAQSIISLIDLTNGQTLFTELVNADNPYVFREADLRAGYTYVLECTSYGEFSAGSANLSYYQQGIEKIDKNKETGGVLVDFVKTYDPVKMNTSFKKYYYSRLNDLKVTTGLIKSSGLISSTPVYLTDYFILMDCKNPNSDNPGMNCGTVFKLYTMTSNSVNNLYAYSQHHIYYQSVIESFGLNFENGGVEHLYNVVPNTPGNRILGNYIAGSPLSNFGVAVNGLETYTNTFEKVGNDFRSLREVKTHYKIDDRLTEIFYGNTVRKRYSPICTYSVPTASQFEAFDFMRNSIFSRWVYADTIKTTTFDKLTSVKTDQTEIYQYGNTTHLLPTKIVNIDSKGDFRETVMNYAKEMIDQGRDQSGTYQGMVNLNMIASPVEVIDQYRGRQMSLLRTNYFTKRSGLYLPLTVETKAENENPETRLAYSYDDKGNITGLTQERTKKTSYVWSYNGQYPIAEIRNADYSTVESLLGGVNAVSTFSNLNPTDGQLRTFLSPLSTNLPNAQITVFTYKPFLGISSKTDPKGMASYYQYDDFQRLLHVRDQNQNIVQSYNYHYISQ
jgi:hypothetical protein